MVQYSVVIFAAFLQLVFLAQISSGLPTQSAQAIRLNHEEVPFNQQLSKRAGPLQKGLDTLKRLKRILLPSRRPSTPSQVQNAPQQIWTEDGPPPPYEIALTHPTTRPIQPHEKPPTPVPEDSSHPMPVFDNAYSSMAYHQQSAPPLYGKHRPGTPSSMPDKAHPPEVDDKHAHEVDSKHPPEVDGKHPERK